LKRLEDEVQALREATHERCLGLKDIYRTKRWVFLVMEKLIGGELFDQIIGKKRFSEPEAKHVFRQVCQGLSFLHSRRIAHRDVKPENILVSGSHASPDGKDMFYDIKLADFGLSKLMGSGSIAMSMVGTPQYWAPEVAASGGTTAYDHRADLWSLGVTLYVMLRGQYPFRGESANTLLQMGKYDLSSGVWSSVSEDAKDLVSKLLRVSPDERLPLEECMKHPWLTGQPRTPSSSSSMPVPSSSIASAQAPSVAAAVANVVPQQTALVRWEDAPRLHVGGDRSGEAFNLRELVQLQVSVTALLEKASLACRQSYPHLSSEITSAIHQASALWQHTLVTIKKYAQVASSVQTKVLPDLALAVQEAEPSLAVELMDMVQEWTAQMRSDGEASQNLCGDLAKRLRDLISKVHVSALPSLPASAASADAPAERAVENLTAAIATDSRCGGINQATRELVDSLARFDNTIQVSDPTSANEECSRRDLIDLLFLAPGVRKPLTASPGGSNRSCDKDVREVDDDGRSVDAMVDVQQSPRVAPQPCLELVCRDNRESQQDLAHPLLHALQELRRVSEILVECIAFWTNMDGTVQELSRLKDHTQRLLKFASKSSALRSRFDERLAEYADFWGSLIRLCEQYCAAAEPALLRMRVLVNQAEAAMDTIELTGGLIAVDNGPGFMRD